MEIASRGIGGCGTGKTTYASEMNEGTPTSLESRCGTKVSGLCDISEARVSLSGWNTCSSIRRVVTVAAVAAFIGTLSITSPPFQGDSAIYVKEILNVYRGAAPFSGLWEFGHLCWRPFLYALTRLFFWTHSGLYRRDSGIKARVRSSRTNHAFRPGMRTASRRCSLSGRLLNWRSRFFGHADSGDSFLSYSQTAASYIPALFFLLFALWWSLDNKRTLFASAAVTGLSLFLSVAFWFPFGLAAPAVAVAGPLLLGRETFVAGESSLILLIFGVAILCGFGLGAYLGGSRDAAGLAKWVHSSSHGWGTEPAASSSSKRLCASAD